MYAFEELAGAYFAVIAGAAPFAPAPAHRRATAAAIAVVLVGLVAVAAAYAGNPLRWWLPIAYLVAGYWLPALLVADERDGDHVARGGFERWLCRTDLRLRPRLLPVPRPLREPVELAYLLCYPLVPVCLTIVIMLGMPADIDRFWLAVLSAGFACYVSLPWLVSRPPRMSKNLEPSGRAHATNVHVLHRFSHRFNTFPSGHVAVALAAAMAVTTVAPAAGALIGVMAVAIAVGAVAGGYHYVVDVFAGAIVALAVGVVIVA